LKREAPALTGATNLKAGENQDSKIHFAFLLRNKVFSPTVTSGIKIHRLFQDIGKVSTFAKHLSYLLRARVCTVLAILIGVLKKLKARSNYPGFF